MGYRCLLPPCRQPPYSTLRRPAEKSARVQSAVQLSTLPVGGIKIYITTQWTTAASRHLCRRSRTHPMRKRSAAKRPRSSLPCSSPLSQWAARFSLTIEPRASTPENRPGSSLPCSSPLCQRAARNERAVKSKRLTSQQGIKHPGRPYVSNQRGERLPPGNGSTHQPEGF